MNDDRHMTLEQLKELVSHTKAIEEFAPAPRPQDAADIAVKHRRVLDQLMVYLDTLPACKMGQYGPEQRAAQEAAQRRVLELCANDREALAEFLIGFTPYVRRKYTEHMARMAQFVGGDIFNVGACVVACPCSGCDLLRRTMTLAGPDGQASDAPPEQPAVAPDWVKDVLATNTEASSAKKPE